ncbi:chromosome partitioning protein ParB, partial [Pseudomonas aeruginosa]
AAWWKPTAEGYFRHVPKAAILEAVGQFAPEHVSRLAKLKKADIANEAERQADGTGWMPAVFQADHDTEPESVPEAAGEAGALEDAADEVKAHALAA